MGFSFQKTFTVSSYEVNPLGRARLTTIANYFQEIAHQHANRLGFGYAAMKSKRTMWLLSRMKIRMDRYPSWDETITVETWPSGVDKLFAVRDFRVTGSQGEVLGTASTCWLIVDVLSHRPIKPKEELENYASIVFLDPVFEGSLDKIPLPDEMESAGKHRVTWSDLDLIGHTNNVKYMEWSINAAVKKAGGQASEQTEIREFEINFMKETQLGDEVVIHIDPSLSVLNGVLAADGTEVFRVRICR